MIKNTREEKQLSSKLVFDGKIVHLYIDEISLPNGNKATREYIKHQGAVCVLPIIDDCALMVEQYRYPFSSVLLEAPAGKIDPGETPDQAAIRELSEETGAEAGSLIPVGTFYPTCAYSDEKIYLYLAKDLKIKGLHLDDDEFLSVKKMSFKELKDLLQNNAIPDGKTQVILYKSFSVLGI